MSPSETLLFCLAISVVTAIVFIFLGYQLSVNQKKHWINGVDFSSLSNPEAFIKAIGRSLINTGVAFLIISALLYVGIIGYIAFALLLTVISVVPIIALVKEQKKYQIDH
ncbi:hypothetical protein [Thalassotalea ganghwensis]